MRRFSTNMILRTVFTVARRQGARVRCLCSIHDQRVTLSIPRLFSSRAEYSHVIKVKMPMLDDDGTTGVVEKWYKKEGELDPAIVL